MRRLRTEYVDLFWLHVWDVVTPAEEVLQTLGDLVRAGRIRYFGLSNVPAWYVAKMATLAGVHGVPAPIALQLEYSLTERAIEHEHLPAAREFGLGVLPWSPLAGGFLAGKYRREDFAGVEKRAAPELPTATDNDSNAASSDDGRLSGSNPFGRLEIHRSQLAGPRRPAKPGGRNRTSAGSGGLGLGVLSAGYLVGPDRREPAGAARRQHRVPRRQA